MEETGELCDEDGRFLPMFPGLVVAFRSVIDPPGLTNFGGFLFSFSLAAGAGVFGNFGSAKFFGFFLNASRPISAYITLTL